MLTGTNFKLYINLFLGTVIIKVKWNTFMYSSFLSRGRWLILGCQLGIVFY